MVVRGLVRRVVRGLVRRVVRGVVRRVVRGVGSVGSPRSGGQFFQLSRRKNLSLVALKMWVGNLHGHFFR